MVTGVWGVAGAVAACSPALPSVDARAAPGWKLAALAWLAVTAVPLALIDMARPLPVRQAERRRLRRPLTLLTIATLTGHQPHRLARYQAALDAGSDPATVAA